MEVLPLVKTVDQNITPPSIEKVLNNADAPILAPKLKPSAFNFSLIIFIDRVDIFIISSKMDTFFNSKCNSGLKSTKNVKKMAFYTFFERIRPLPCIFDSSTTK